jgi:hypothetical protein
MAWVDKDGTPPRMMGHTAASSSRLLNLWRAPPPLRRLSDTQAEKEAEAALAATERRPSAIDEWMQAQSKMDCSPKIIQTSKNAMLKRRVTQSLPKNVRPALTMAYNFFCIPFHCASLPEVNTAPLDTDSMILPSSRSRTPSQLCQAP